MIFSKGSGINDSIYGKSQEPIKMILEQQEEAFENDSIIPKLFAQEKTNTFASKYTYETSLDNFEPVGENGSYDEGTYQEGYSKVIEPETWKKRFTVTQEMVEDANYGKIKQGANQFMLSYNRTKELFASAIINNGNQTTMAFGKRNKSFDISGADGQALFSTAHPSKTGGYGTQRNLYGDAFSYDALCYAEEAMHYIRDDDGNLLDVQPDTIVIPYKAPLLKAVFDAIGAEGIPNTSNNSFNYQFGRWNVIASPYLTNWAGITSGKNMWYLFDSKYNDAYKGLIWLKRIELTVKSYIDNNTDANVFQGRARYGAGVNNWRPIMAFAPGLAGTTNVVPS